MMLVGFIQQDKKKRQDKIFVVAHAHETMQHTSYYMHSNRDLHLEKSDK